MQNETFSTKDLCLASTLYAFDISSDNVHKTVVNGRVIAKFEYSRNLDELNAIVTDFFSKKIEIEPQTFFFALRQMKNMIYSDI